MREGLGAEVRELILRMARKNQQLELRLLGGLIHEYQAAAARTELTHPTPHPSVVPFG
jgi:hypothetical protein